MNGLNVYKIAQIGGLGLAGVMFFLLTVVGWYETSTAITWVIFMLVGTGIFFGAGKLDEAERDRRLDEESRDRRLKEKSRDR